jgi:hypothetical protein
MLSKLMRTLQEISEKLGETIHAIHEGRTDYNELIGTRVKVRTGDEKFWVKVIECDDETIIGRVENLVCKHSYKVGDLITFTCGDIDDFRLKQSYYFP